MSGLKSRTGKPRGLPARILAGSVVLLSGSGLTTVTNLAYNIAVAQVLGPIGFGHVTAVYTLLVLISAVTLSFQLASAKLVAQQASNASKYSAYRGFHQGAWASGLAVALLLIVFQRPIAAYLHLPTPLLVCYLAAGAAFYVPLGCRRGYLQGAYGFRRLAANLVLEGFIRLGGSLLLMWMGFGVRGVIAANSAAVAAAWLAISPDSAGFQVESVPRRHALREVSQAIVFFAGQVLINNCDIVLVKHFFLAETAGLYAAVAMVGRVIYAFSTAVVNSMFPLVAGTSEDERRDLKVIATSLLLVLSIGLGLSLLLLVAPDRVWVAAFGAKFHIEGQYGLPYLLALYAVTTVIYSLSAVIITFEMSYKIAHTSWVQLLFSGLLIAGICRFHASLRQVIVVQLWLMLALFVCVALPFLLDSLTLSNRAEPRGRLKPLRLLRTVSEDEVIAEFLRSDFGKPDFHEFQEAFGSIVANPDLRVAGENEKRRALFFTRHLALWDELPSDTIWHEVAISTADLGSIRVFPRAQWRRVADGNFSLARIVKCIAKRRDSLDERFVRKLDLIGSRISAGEPPQGAILLIGVRENAPHTVLDGNHRLVAALMAAPTAIDHMKFFCGLSPSMTECCWYNTSMSTLFRYGRNLLRQVRRRPRAELERILQSDS